MAESRDQSLDGSRDDSWRLIDPESVCEGLELLELEELVDGKLGDELCIPPPPIEDDEEDDDEDDGLEEMLGEPDVVV